MRKLICLLGFLCLTALAPAADKKAATNPQGSSYLFVWAGDEARKASDFLAVVDVNPSSPRYGRIVSRVAVGATALMPHHTEYEYPSDNHLFANGWAAGHTYVFDLSNPMKPRVSGQFTSRGGYSYPHSFVRLPNGHVLATFQSHSAAYEAGGGLVEMDQDGVVVRSASAVDPAVSGDEIWPYSLAISPKLDVAVESMTPMPLPAWAKLPPGSWPLKKAENQLTTHVQVWRISDLKLLKTVELPATEGKHNQWPAEPRLLSDGTVYVNTFSCGLYRMKDLDAPEPSAEQVFTFPGFAGDIMTTCGVPVVVGHYWVQTVGGLPGLIVLDISNPEKPVEVSRLKLDGSRYPMVHWISADRKSDRVVITGDMESWILVAHLDPATGKLSLDESFHAPGSKEPGIKFDAAALSQGHGGRALVHGTLFGQ